MSGLLGLTMMMLGAPTVRHEFVWITGRDDVSAVNIAGTFNGWNGTAHPMTPSNRDGKTRWVGAVELPYGKHLYKFVVNGREWIVDPKAKSEDDGGGNTNSILMILPEDYAQPAEVADSRITASPILHRPTLPSLNYDQGKLNFRLSVRSNDVARVELDLKVGGKEQPAVAMEKLTSDQYSETLIAKVPWDGNAPVEYRFRLVDGYLLKTYGVKGLGDEEKFKLDPKSYKPFRVPSWVERTVFYQIFPDRFENGSVKNDPKEKAPWNSEPTYWNRYGGDIAGVMKRKDYLKTLGINGVYFNPMMLGNSNHRYDPCDFFLIDPEFGTNQEFIDMTHALHKAGIRVVLDQIFDHVGIHFPQFVDVLKNQEKSKYKDWFFIKKWPIEVKQNPNYEAWYNAESMPKINVLNPEVQKHLLESVDFWQERAKLSGWRLDVANEPPMEWWRIFRPHVKKNHQDMWILGEVWSNASQWLQGDQWDASMNYPFRFASLDFFAKKNITGEHYVNRLFEAYSWYAPQVSRNQMNLLSSHDTARFLTDIGGDKALMKVAATAQFGWPGTPSIYYGEELGMEGGHDPQNRRGMRWDLAVESNPMLQHYKKLIRAKTEEPVLQAGAPFRLKGEWGSDVAVFGRRYADQAALVAINRSETPQQVEIVWEKGLPNQAWTCALTNKKIYAKEGRIQLRLEGKSSVMALPENSLAK